MGWGTVSLQVSGVVSNHNSQQDIDDEADWEDFVHRVTMIAKEHRYEKLRLDVY